MKMNLRQGFTAGLLGSLAVAGALGLLVLAGTIPKAPFVAAYQSTFGGGWILATIAGGLLFVLFGALWAVPFALLVPNPTVLKGMAYGLLPTLWAWTFVPAVLTGGALFGGLTAKGLLIPVVMNVLIWGSIVGWYGRRTAAPRPAERAAERAA